MMQKTPCGRRGGNGVPEGKCGPHGAAAPVFHLIKKGGDGSENGAPETDVLVQTAEDWAVEMLARLRQEADAAAAQWMMDNWEVDQDAFVRLSPRLKDRREAGAPPGSFTIDWATRYMGPFVAGQRKTFSKYIRKGKGDRYSVKTLQRHALDWQIPLIKAAEDRFAPIRRQARAVIELRRRVREYAKLEAALRETGATGDEDEEGWA